MGFAAFAGLLIRGAAPTALVALLLLGSIDVWSRRHPAQAPETIEDMLISEQILRARTMTGSVDWVILGDSSALMGIDPVELGRRLGGKRVESLALFGYTGAAAYGELLELASARAEIRGVLVMMNAGSLSLEDGILLSGSIRDQASGPRTATGARDKIFYDGLGGVVDYPLPGSFGRHYGWPEDLRRAIREDHGGLVDPNRRWNDRRKTTAQIYSVSLSVESRLKRLGESLQRVGVRKALCGFTPIPDVRNLEESLRSRELASRRYSAALGIEFLNTPESMPERSFATSTHLSPQGRQAYTECLADLLNRLP